MVDGGVKKILKKIRSFDGDKTIKEFLNELVEEEIGNPNSWTEFYLKTTKKYANKRNEKK